MSEEKIKDVVTQFADEKVWEARKQILDISDQLDLEYDVVLAPVI